MISCWIFNVFLKRIVKLKEAGDSLLKSSSMTCRDLLWIKCSKKRMLFVTYLVFSIFRLVLRFLASSRTTQRTAQSPRSFKAWLHSTLLQILSSTASFQPTSARRFATCSAVERSRQTCRRGWRHLRTRHRQTSRQRRMVEKMMQAWGRCWATRCPFPSVLRTTECESWAVSALWREAIELSE